MEAAHFDHLVWLLGDRANRRGVLGLGLSVAGILRARADTAEAKKKHKHKKKKRKKKRCASKCAGKACGPCAAPRACQSGQCVCPEDECNGACMDACEPFQTRNPLTCDCCLLSGAFSCDPDSAAMQCCSGNCLAGPPGSICVGLSPGSNCDFDAQCASGDCLPGTNGGPGTCFGS